MVKSLEQRSLNYFLVVKVKVKFTLEQTTKAQRGSIGIALLFLYPRRQIEMGVQHHAPAILLPEKFTVPIV